MSAAAIPARRWIATVASAASAAALLAGCGGSGVLSLGPRPVTACYRSIPAALREAPGAHPHLVGVHRLRAAALGRRVPALAAQLRGTDPWLCAVALEGPFAAGQLSGTPPGAAARYAIVLVRASDGQVVATVLLDRLPHKYGARTY